MEPPSSEIALSRPNVLMHVLDQHFEEVDFLLEQRERVALAPDWTLHELADLEERAEAHLSGLLIGQAHAVDLVEPYLSSGEPSAATAAALALLAFDENFLRKRVLEALATADPPSREGVRIALRHSTLGALEAPLVELVRTAPTEVALAAADALAFHRRLRAEDLPSLAAAEESGSLALAFGAFGRARGALEEVTIGRAIDGDPTVARAALEAGARIGFPGLLALTRSAAAGAEAAPVALEFLGVIGEPGDLATLRRALASKALAPAALRGMGALGSPEAIPEVIEAMQGELAEDAGRAFSRITGVPLEDLHPGTGSGGGEEPVDDEDGALVSGGRARELWDEGRGRFDVAGVYQAGHDMTRDPLGPGFERLPLASRRDLYLRARLANPTATSDLELESLALKQLGIASTLRVSWR